ncbi:unnamed protein product, partial [Amoebophrya sp. A25]
MDFKEKDYYLGVMSGFISVTRRSSGLPAGVIEDLTDNTVRRPQQPMARSLIMMLDPKAQYLLVELYSAEGLPVVDTDRNTTNAMARLTYDGCVLESTVNYNTLRPVWNQYLHFPVRYVNPAIRSD